MELKSYSFTRVNQFGAVQNCYITVDGQNFTWAYKTFNVIFNNYESAEEAGRGTLPRAPFEMSLKGNDFLSAAMAAILQFSEEMPDFDEWFENIWNHNGEKDALKAAFLEIIQNLLETVGTPFLIAFSDRIWEMAKDTKFIPDYSEIGEDNKRIMNLKSLADLNAQMIQVPLSN